MADKLKKKYEKEFPATLWGTPTPLICACQKGRLEDVKLLITGHDANGTVMYMGIPCRAMTLKEYVNQFGLGSRAHEGKFTPLTIAALYKHFHIVQYLIEQCGVYPGDALYWATSENPHLAASDNKKNTDLIRFLLNHMSADSINNKLMGETPLDRAYKNEIPNKQEIIDLIRSKGGKRGDFA